MKIIGIFADDLPILKANEDERDGRGYALCARDGTVIAKYSAEKLSVLDELLKFYKRHMDEISVSKHRQFIDYLLKQGIAVKMDITLDQLGVHLFNTRYVPMEDIEDFEQVVALAEQGRLLNEILVTPVDSDMVNAFKYTAESAKKHGRDPVNVLEGILCRRAMPEGSKLVVLEDDRLYQLAMRCGWRGAEEDGRMEIKYLIVDGYIRFEAACKAFEVNADKWKKVPTISAIVIPAPPTNPRKPVLGMDPVAAFYFSVTANSFARDINKDLSNFVRLFQAGDVIAKIGARMRFDLLERLGHSMKLKEEVEIKQNHTKQETIGAEYYEPMKEPIGEKRLEEEEEKREERRWMRREEPTVKEVAKPAVSEAQKPAPALPYASAQQQAPVQMPMPPPALAQSIREEAQRSAQTQPVQLNEISVLSVVLDQYFARHNLQAHYYVFQGKGVDVRLDYNLKKALENSGLSGRSLEVDIRYTNIPDLPVKGMQLKARVYVPVAWNKHCPNCGHLIVLSPTRCVFCGEVISPLPYVVSYKPAGT
jgi:hypothetical protein